MKILAIDTSTTQTLGLAISDNSEIISGKSVGAIEDLSQEIAPAIAILLKESGLSLSSIDGVAINLGPGSFTGLRIGLSAAKALCLALNKPLVGISSLEILAAGLDIKVCQVCSIIDAKRDNVYACLYEKKGAMLKKITPFLLVNIDNLLRRIRKKTLFTGDGLYLYRNKILKQKKGLSFFAKEKFWQPDAGSLARLAYERFKKGLIDCAEKASPIYLYPKECQIRKS